MTDKEVDTPTIVQSNLKLLLEQSSILPLIGESWIDGALPSRSPIYGKTSGKDGPEEKKDDGELWCNVEAQAAFLGPNLWDKTYDADLKYVDLDEFLSENGIPVEGLPGTQHLKQAQAAAQQQAQQQQQQQPPQGPPQPQPQALGPHQPAAPAPAPAPHPPHPQHAQHPHPHQHPHPAGPAVVAVAPGPVPTLELVAKRERSPSPCEPRTPDTEPLNPPSPADSTLSLASSGRDFDPRTRAFSDEELKPQPMIKKSRKQFVPDDMKDEKYWARRRKNNLAAKRSRDARRVKENQIALRAGFLEKENMNLRQELDRLKKENMLLRDKLSKFTEV